MRKALLLQGNVPKWVKLPASVALPFGSFEAALADPANSQVREELDARCSGGNAPQALTGIRETVGKLKPLAPIREQLAAALQKEGAVAVLCKS